MVPEVGDTQQAKPGLLDTLRSGHSMERSASFTSSLSDFHVEIPKSYPSRPIPRRASTNNANGQSTREGTEIRDRFTKFWKRNLGLILVALSGFFGAFMTLSTKMLETKFDPPFEPLQVLGARMSITCLACFAYCWYKSINIIGPKDVRWLLVGRGITGFVGVFGLYFSLSYLSLSDATVLLFLGPIATGFTCSMALGEPFTRQEKLAGLLSLFGVFLIAKPSTLLHAFGVQSSESQTSSTPADIAAITAREAAMDAENQITPQQRGLAVVLGLLGVCGGAGAFTFLRSMGTRAHPLISVIYFSVCCLIVSTFSLLFVPGVNFILPSSLEAWGWLGIVGVAGFVVQFLLAAGLQREKGGRAATMTYLQIVYALGFERLFWGTYPDLLSVSGSTLILGGAAWVALSKAKQPSKPDDVEEAGSEGEATQMLPPEDEMEDRGEEYELDEAGELVKVAACAPHPSDINNGTKEFA